MALSWGIRRQLLYYAAAGVVGAVLLWGGYSAFFTSTSTCQDGAQNGTERGVDCGGSCAPLCASEARAPVVRWARAFRTGPQTYTAAAYVENHNPGAYAPDAAYTFQLFDENNLLVVERTGTMTLPPVQTVPVIEPNINVGNRTVERTLFSFSRVPLWLRAQEGEFAALRATSPVLEEGGSRLSATLINDSRFDATVQAGAVLFDANGVAQAASRTTLEIPRKSQEPIFFSWQGGVPGAIRAEITVLPLPQ